MYNPEVYLPLNDMGKFDVSGAIGKGYLNVISEGKGAEDILNDLLGEKELVITEKYPCRYVCNFSRDRMERNLISLGKKELISLADEQNGAELQCHFCNSKYSFTESEIKELIQ